MSETVERIELRPALAQYTMLLKGDCDKCKLPFVVGSPYAVRVWKTPTMAVPAYTYMHVGCALGDDSKSREYRTLLEAAQLLLARLDGPASLSADDYQELRAAVAEYGGPASIEH